MEINKILKADLLDERITGILGGNYIYKLHKPENEKTNIYIEYFVVRDEDTDFCGNTSLTNENLLQIDVFGLDGAAVSKVMKTVRTVLKEKNYRYENGYENYEEDTKLYTEKIRVYKEITKNQD